MPGKRIHSWRNHDRTITEHLTHVASVLADAVVDDAEAGVYRANRRIFTDEEIFELEMKHIFEGNWIYLAHESQVPNPGDYFTTYIGTAARGDHPGQGRRAAPVSSTPAPTAAR